MGEVTGNIELPDRLYFKIGEASRILGVKPYVLRYWEQEFKVLRPEKSKTNHRIYSRKDMKTLFLIKKLLYEERFTIEGAKARIREIECGKIPAKDQHEEGGQLAVIERADSIGGSFLEELEKTKKELKEAMERINELKEQLIIQKKASEERERALWTMLAGLKTGIFEIMNICEEEKIK